jgi:hypothetical protein
MLLDNIKFCLRRILFSRSNNVFLLNQGDLVAFIRHLDENAIDKYSAEMRHLFHDDPIIRSHFGLNEKFYRFYSLLNDFESVLRVIDSSAQESIKPEGIKFDPISFIPCEILNQIQKNRQHICKINSGKFPEPIGYEYYLSVDAIQKALKTDFNFLAQPEFFKYITLFFDKRALPRLTEFLRRSSSTDAFHMNLNLKTITSKEFYDLIAKLKLPVTVEIDRSDYFMDRELLKTAKEFLKNHQSKLCLDLIDGPSLSFFMNQEPDCDFYKIIYTPHLFDHYGESLDKFLDHIGRPRVILARCDERKAIEKGLFYGIRYFQGFYIEKTLKDPKSEPFIAKEG